MSVTRLSRDRGIVIHCSHGRWEGNADCAATHVTANVLIKVNRAEAKRAGWGRGGKGRKRDDYCPEHLKAEKLRLAQIDAAKRDRAAKRAAKKAIGVPEAA
jgi:hypothetical protein